MDDPLQLDSLVDALVARRLAGLDYVWMLGFADVRRAARLLALTSKSPVPTTDELSALMAAFPDQSAPKETDDG